MLIVISPISYNGNSLHCILLTFLLFTNFANEITSTSTPQLHSSAASSAPKFCRCANRNISAGIEEGVEEGTLFAEIRISLSASHRGITSGKNILFRQWINIHRTSSLSRFDYKCFKAEKLS